MCNDFCNSHGIVADAAPPPAEGRVDWPEPFWRCPECGCHSFARIHVTRADGTYGDGPDIRCVHCKQVFTKPPRIALPGPFHAEAPRRRGDLHEVYEDSAVQDGGRVWVGQLSKAAVDCFAALAQPGAAGGVPAGHVVVPDLAKVVERIADAFRTYPTSRLTSEQAAAVEEARVAHRHFRDLGGSRG